VSQVIPQPLLRSSVSRLDYRQNLHFGLSLALFGLGFPLSRIAELKTNTPIALIGSLPAITAQGVSMAALLFGWQKPAAVFELLTNGDRRRFYFLIPVIGLLFFLYEPLDAALFSVAAVAIAEFLTSQRQSWRTPLCACLIPVAYFLFGFGIVYEFNDIIATFCFYGLYDKWLLRVDSWILFSGSVSGLSRWAQAHTFPSFFGLLEGIYFGTFAQLGAGIVLTGLLTGLSRALRLVGTILLSYYVTLICFLLLPSHGPYLLCADHFRTFPSALTSYTMQQVFLTNARTLFHHHGVVMSSGGYYISFPCMHITQPLIVLWFLRSYRRILVVLAVYDLCLIPTILLLEWHYAVDILGGILIAAFAIYIVGDKDVEVRGLRLTFAAVGGR